MHIRIRLVDIRVIWEAWIKKYCKMALILRCVTSKFIFNFQQCSVTLGKTLLATMHIPLSTGVLLNYIPTEISNKAFLLHCKFLILNFHKRVRCILILIIFICSYVHNGSHNFRHIFATNILSFWTKYIRWDPSLPWLIFRLKIDKNFVNIFILSPTHHFYAM